jgi:hypothetical protein
MNQRFQQLAIDFSRLNFRLAIRSPPVVIISPMMEFLGWHRCHDITYTHIEIYVYMHTYMYIFESIARISLPTLEFPHAIRSLPVDII